MLACELRLWGVRVAVLEQLAEPTGLSKAFGFHVRSVETLAYRGLLERFTSDKHAALRGFAQYAAFPIDLQGIDSPHPYSLAIVQARTEAILEERARELGVEIRRGHAVADLREEGDAVVITVRRPSGDYSLRASYLVGCDGARSVVRERAGIRFVGSDPTLLTRMGDVSLPAACIEPRGVRVPGVGSIPFGLHRTEHGLFSASPLAAGGYRISSTEWGKHEYSSTPLTLDELQSSIRRVLGADLPMSEPQWLTRFNDTTKQAERYRVGRVLVAGDAAHVHFPSGGQGLNMGVQDAVNLGWKLAAQIQRWAPEGLLDTYDSERRPLGARVLRFTRSQVALLGPGAHTTALREVFAEMLEHADIKRLIVERTAQVDTHYEMPGESGSHPLLGRWAPDLELTTASGNTRVAALMHHARGLFVDLTEQPRLRALAARWSDRVDVVAGRGAGKLPANAMLVRPDGYVAWALSDGEPSERAESRLATTLTTWFGEPTARTTARVSSGRAETTPRA
jgi:2-polyprenyl-6-methoxyphenol hydroxylase-like FAD-dependent oxidoreductase